MTTIENGLDYLVVTSDSKEVSLDYAVNRLITKSLTYSVLNDEIEIYRKTDDGEWEYLTTRQWAESSFVDEGPFTYEVTYHYKARRRQIHDGIITYLTFSNEDDVVINAKAIIYSTLVYKVFLTQTIQRSLIYRVLTIGTPIEKGVGYVVTRLAAPWINSSQINETIEVSWWA